MAAAVAVNNPTNDKEPAHTDVMLFNRWTYDDVQVLLNLSHSICIAAT